VSLPNIWSLGRYFLHFLSARCNNFDEIEGATVREIKAIRLIHPVDSLRFGRDVFGIVRLSGTSLGFEGEPTAPFFLDSNDGHMLAFRSIKSFLNLIDQLCNIDAILLCHLTITAGGNRVETEYSGLLFGCRNPVGAVIHVVPLIEHRRIPEIIAEPESLNRSPSLQVESGHLEALPPRTSRRLSPSMRSRSLGTAAMINAVTAPPQRPRVVIPAGGRQQSHTNKRKAALSSPRTILLGRGGGESGSVSVGSSDRPSSAPIEKGETSGQRLLRLLSSSPAALSSDAGEYLSLGDEIQPEELFVGPSSVHSLVRFGSLNSLLAPQPVRGAAQTRSDPLRSDASAPSPPPPARSNSISGAGISPQRAVVSSGSSAVTSSTEEAYSSPGGALRGEAVSSSSLYWAPSAAGGENVGTTSHSFTDINNNNNSMLYYSSESFTHDYVVDGDGDCSRSILADLNEQEPAADRGGGGRSSAKAISMGNSLFSQVICSLKSKGDIGTNGSICPHPPAVAKDDCTVVVAGSPANDTALKSLTANAIADNSDNAEIKLSDKSSKSEVVKVPEDDPVCSSLDKALRKSPHLAEHKVFRRYLAKCMKAALCTDNTLPADTAKLILSKMRGYIVGGVVAKRAKRRSWTAELDSLSVLVCKTLHLIQRLNYKLLQSHSTGRFYKRILYCSIYICMIGLFFVLEVEREALGTKAPKKSKLRVDFAIDSFDQIAILIATQPSKFLYPLLYKKLQVDGERNSQNDSTKYSYEVEVDDEKPFYKALIDFLSSKYKDTGLHIMSRLSETSDAEEVSEPLHVRQNSVNTCIGEDGEMTKLGSSATSSPGVELAESNTAQPRALKRSLSFTDAVLQNKAGVSGDSLNERTPQLFVSAAACDFSSSIAKSDSNGKMDCIDAPFAFKRGVNDEIVAACNKSSRKSDLQCGGIKNPLLQNSPRSSINGFRP
jgi:hypothetical protein